MPSWTLCGRFLDSCVGCLLDATQYFQKPFYYPEIWAYPPHPSLISTLPNWPIQRITQFLVWIWKKIFHFAMISESGVLKKTLFYFLIQLPLPVILWVLEEFAFTPVTWCFPHLWVFNLLDRGHPRFPSSALPRVSFPCLQRCGILCSCGRVCQKQLHEKLLGMWWVGTENPSEQLGAKKLRQFGNATKREGVLKSPWVLRPSQYPCLLF